MSPSEVWPPPLPQPPSSPPKRPEFIWPNIFVVALAVAASLANAWRDIHLAGGPFDLSALRWDAVVVVLPALLQPRYTWLWGVIETSCMATTHVMAINHGLGMPYVENSPIEAIVGCMMELVPLLVIAYLVVAFRKATIEVVKMLRRAKNTPDQPQ